MNSPHDLSLSIAALPVTISLGGLEQSSQRLIVERYAAFAVPERARAPRFELHIEPGPPFIPFQVGGSWQVRTTASEGRIEFESHLEKGWIDISGGEGSLVMRPEGNPENFLRVLYAWLCLENDAVLLHAAGIVREGRGYVFFGPSGSGKTTVTRLSLDNTVLSDDLVILKREGDMVRVHGVPFRGDMPEAPRTNVSAVVQGLFMLVKGVDHRLTPVPQVEAAARLTACVPFVMADPANAARVLVTCASIVERMPVRALHFRPDSEFWRVIDGG